MNKLRSVEEIMSMKHEIVRHHPVDAISTVEFLERIETLLGDIYTLAAAGGVHIDSAGCFSFTDPLARINPTAALEAISDLEWNTIRAAHTLGLGHDFDTNFQDTLNRHRSYLLASAHKPQS